MPGPIMKPSEAMTLRKMLRKQPELVSRWEERAAIRRHEYTTQCPDCGDVRDWLEVLEMMLFCSKCGCSQVEILMVDNVPSLETVPG